MASTGVRVYRILGAVFGFLGGAFVGFFPAAGTGDTASGFIVWSVFTVGGAIAGGIYFGD